MVSRLFNFSTALATLVVGAVGIFSPAQSAALDQRADQRDRGEYIFHLSGCVGCHTDKKGGGKFLSGGRAFKTDFGTFYSPNITPDKNTGLGNWTFENFQTALRDGISPNGENYFPSFPYTSYTHMSDGDINDLWVYLQSTPKIKQDNRDHDLKMPYGWRWTVSIWKELYLDKGAKPDWSRGRYVTEALAHCQECHTPRNFLGGSQDQKAFSGTKRNPEGLAIPNITPDPQTGVGKWNNGDFELLFTIGMLPDTDFVGGAMAESISHTTSKMTKQDRQAMIKYLNQVNPIENRIKAKKAPETNDEEW